MPGSEIKTALLGKAVFILYDIKGNEINNQDFVVS